MSRDVTLFSNVGLVLLWWMYIVVVVDCNCASAICVCFCGSARYSIWLASRRDLLAFECGISALEVVGGWAAMLAVFQVCDSRLA